jgi:hypothetical protein
MKERLELFLLSFRLGLRCDALDYLDIYTTLLFRDISEVRQLISIYTTEIIY